MRDSCCCGRRTTLIPYEEYNPRNLWSKVAAPDPRFWETTGTYNVPMNLTWVKGTMYVVRDVLHFTSVLRSMPKYGACMWGISRACSTLTFALTLTLDLD